VAAAAPGVGVVVGAAGVPALTVVDVAVLVVVDAVGAVGLAGVRPDAVLEVLVGDHHPAVDHRDDHRAVACVEVPGGLALHVHARDARQADGLSGVAVLPARVGQIVRGGVVLDLEGGLDPQDAVGALPVGDLLAEVAVVAAAQLIPGVVAEAVIHPAAQRAGLGGQPGAAAVALDHQRARLEAHPPVEVGLEGLGGDQPVDIQRCVLLGGGAAGGAEQHPEGAGGGRYGARRGGWMRRDATMAAPPVN